MLSLIFKILGDAAGFKKTVTKDVPDAAKEGGKKAGKSAGSEFGKEFGQQVKGAVLGAIGVGAIVAEIKKAVAEAGDIAREASAGGISVEAQQELRRASKLSGLSVEQLLESATKAPKQFSALMRQAQGRSGLDMNQAEVEQLNQVGSGFSDAGSVTGKVAARSGSYLGWKAGETLGNVALLLGTIAKTQEEMTGLKTKWSSKGTDWLTQAGVGLQNYGSESYQRMLGKSQGTTSTPGGELVAEMKKVNATLEKKL